MKCPVCKKQKGKSQDRLKLCCAWNGEGNHPRFVWYRIVRREPRTFCSNCPDQITMRELYLKDRETKELFCLDCGMLIVRGIEYQEKKSQP